MQKLLLMTAALWLGAACASCGTSPDSQSSTGEAGSAGAAALGGSAGSSGSAPGGTGGTAGADPGGTGGTAGTGGTGGTGNPSPLCDLPRPSQVPAGWVPFTDFSCEMPLWLPSRAEELPPPIAWDRCTDSRLPPSLSCRMMRADWPHKLSTRSISGSVHVPRDGSPPLFYFMRSSGSLEPPQDTLVIAEVDGAVRFAAMSTRRLTQGLRVSPSRGFDGVTFGVQLSGDRPGTHADSSPVQGVAVGRVGELGLRLFRKETTEQRLSWTVNSTWVERATGMAGTLDLFPLSGGPSVPFYHPGDDPVGGQAYITVLNGADAFTDVANLHISRVLAYDPLRGSHTLIGEPGDPKEGDQDIGTDGRDLVWTHGSDHPDGEGYYPTKVIMTAPYTTDPAALRPRALRKNLARGEFGPFAVGCGYAASVSVADYGIQVVRLSDGHGWTIGAGTTLPGTFGAVVGLTCDEVFIEWGANGTYVAIRLDSLGPGTPSDL